MKRVVRCALLPLVLSCRDTPVVAHSNDPSAVILAFVKERAGYANPLILDTSVGLPEIFSDFTRDSWVDSGVVQVKEALRDLEIRNRQRVRWDHGLIRAVGARPVSTRPTYESLTWAVPDQMVISISTPGFSSDSSVAVVYWSHYCRILCSGAVALFRRDSSGVWTGWRSQMMVWMS